ncbi:ABC transporter permease [Cnuibacter physcomitrellae]|uniref:Peptide ABC transporter permease n=1 Tax=Cnuibacter physcomitrellae TaxID=1619308 RepID=A0A1X9LKH8_9MICO|nr:ABC transporter permease [Cnuibacter physcomitrellae]ARJ05716.1 peptide ABC transporter permease [Cnuibacter physcomitrellae]MCS5496573.1 ABC transporter permease [Cnuibacter physcomitrellae]GGI36322.1 ABC transporter permease [Cnuibacter physcomitrellae]
MSSNTPTRSANHYVAPLEETPLVAVDAVKVAEKPSNLWIDAWRDMRRRVMFWISAAIILLVVIVALFPGLFTQTPPNDDCFLSNSNGGPTDGHPLGYTKLGCDIYSRIIHGTSTSLSVGIIVIILTTVLGILFGMFAGYYGGWIDSVLSRAGDIFFSIPYILAAVVIMSVFSAYRNVFVISLAIGIFAWPSTARVLRAEILRVKNSDYVMASQALGVSRFRILIRHVLPNSIAPVIVVTTISLAAAIVAEATLSFLGVGLPNSTMSWGNDISAAQTDLRTAPQTLIYPSIALSITVLSFIMLGEVVRDALDPKARAQR